MTAATQQEAPARAGADPAIGRRLRPLVVGLGLQTMIFWLPIEKVFLTGIGFDAAAIGLLAAVYAAVVPLIEVPSGVLADRWSRNGVLILATVALAGASLIGGLSNNLPTYAVAAALLGVFFALSSGTAESIVYDALVEESGSADAYESWLGRLHTVQASALVVGAVGGGLLASFLSPRSAYFATVPVVTLAIVAFARLREPELHRVHEDAAERVTYRRQAVSTLRALSSTRMLRRAVLLVALTALAEQVVFEFGPLWLVSAHTPASWFGPYWAALVSTVGIGGWLASRVDFDRASTVVAITGAAVIGPVVLVLSSTLAVVIVMQLVVVLTLSVLGIRASFLLQEGVVAQLRAGVSSGASTLAWLIFVPVSLLFGWITRAHGVHTAGWLLVLATAALAALLSDVRSPAVPTGSAR